MAPRFLPVSGGYGKKKLVTRSAKAGLLFSVGRIMRCLKEGSYTHHMSSGAPVYLAAILEYLAAEVLELAGGVAKDNKKKLIVMGHLIIGIKSDEEIIKLLDGVTIPKSGVMPRNHPALLCTKTAKKAGRWTKKTAEKAAKSPKKTGKSPKKA